MNVTVTRFSRIKPGKGGSSWPRCSKAVAYNSNEQCTRTAHFSVNGKPTCRQHASALALEVCLAAEKRKSESAA